MITALVSKARGRMIVFLPPPTVKIGLADHTQQIAQTQDVILNELPTEEFEVIHQYQTLPGLDSLLKSRC